MKIAVLLTTLAVTAISTVRADHVPRAVLPDAVVDLRTAEGGANVQAQWRYSDTQIQGIAHRDVALT